jgi:hypothetical protein
MSGYFARLMAQAAPVAAAPRAAPAVAPLEQVVEVESVPVGVARPVASAPVEAARGVEPAVSSVPGPTVQREGLPAAAAVAAAPSAMPLPASTPARNDPPLMTAQVRGIETQALSSTAARSNLLTPQAPSLARPTSSTLAGIETAVPTLQAIPTETHIALDAGRPTPSARGSVDALDLQATLPVQTAAHAAADTAPFTTPAAIASATLRPIDATPSPGTRTDATATPLAPPIPSRRDAPARPDVHIGTVSLEVRLPPPAAPAARPAPAPAAAAPAPAAPRFSPQRHYLRWS